MARKKVHGAIILTRVPLDMYEQVIKEARDQGISISDAARQAFELWLLARRTFKERT